MGGLKDKLPVTYWTFLIGTLAIAGVPLLSGFFSKDEILWKTFSEGHVVLWALAVLTAFLTATYMFRLLYLTFFGERRYGDDHAHDAHGHHAGADHGHGHGGGHGLHDAPPAMAIALVVLAVGSVAAGYVGVPNAIVHGGNRIEAFLAPSFAAPLEVPAAGPGTAPGSAGTNEAEVHSVGLELGLMALSTIVALAGIGVATTFFLKAPERASAMSERFAGLHRLLLNKYYVDEAYDASVVQPIKRTSSGFLWRGVDAGLIDGTVNGVGLAVRGWSAVLRRMQTGSVRAYAMSLFVGALGVLGYYLWR
jgi:NADH-quinone oxidoreductase subunit L